MLKPVITAVRSLLTMTILTGIAYPLVITGIAKAAFPGQADGSVITRAGRPAGSRLIGQNFDAPKYVWGRLSATTPPYNAKASTGSNFGPNNAALTDAAKVRIDALRSADPGNNDPIPVDLVTASGSGLDPDITPAAALFQVRRVARERGLDEGRVRKLVKDRIEGPFLGLLGEPHVNVLDLNVAIDELR